MLEGGTCIYAECCGISSLGLLAHRRNAGMPSVARFVCVRCIQTQLLAIL